MPGSARPNNTASNNMMQKVGAPIKQRDSMLPKPSTFAHDEYSNNAVVMSGGLVMS